MTNMDPREAPQPPVEEVVKALGPLADNFGRLVTELENEKYYRNQAERRTRWQRWQIAVVSALAVLLLFGLSFLNNRVVRSIQSCTTAPKQLHANPKDYTCYERAQSNQAGILTRLREQEDEVIRQRDQELLNAVNARSAQVNFGTLPPIVIQTTPPATSKSTTPTTRSVSSPTTRASTTTTTTTPHSSTTTTTTQPSPPSTTCVTADGLRICR